MSMKVLLAHHGFDHEAQVFSNGIPVAFAHDLAGILDREFDFQVLVPVGVDLEFALTYPCGIILVNVLTSKLCSRLNFFSPARTEKVTCPHSVLRNVFTPNLLAWLTVVRVTCSQESLSARNMQ
jgi:hypothetical protein